MIHSPLLLDWKQSEWIASHIPRLLLLIAHSSIAPWENHLFALENALITFSSTSSNSWSISFYFPIGKKLEHLPPVPYSLLRFFQFQTIDTPQNISTTCWPTHPDLRLRKLGNPICEFSIEICQHSVPWNVVIPPSTWVPPLLFVGSALPPIFHGWY